MYGLKYLMDGSEESYQKSFMSARSMDGIWTYTHDPIYAFRKPPEHLHSVIYTKESWRSEQVATCRNMMTVLQDNHNAPDEDCTCGIYAWTDPAAIGDDFFESIFYGSPGYLCLTEHYGKIIVHENGIRSECARLVSVLGGCNRRIQMKELLRFLFKDETNELSNLVKYGNLVNREWGLPVLDRQQIRVMLWGG